MADPARWRLAAETHRETGLTSVFQGRQTPPAPARGKTAPKVFNFSTRLTAIVK